MTFEEWALAACVVFSGLWSGLLMLTLVMHPMLKAMTGRDFARVSCERSCRLHGTPGSTTSRFRDDRGADRRPRRRSKWHSVRAHCNRPRAHRRRAAARVKPARGAKL